MTEVTLSGAWMALTDPNGFTPRRGEGASRRTSPREPSHPSGPSGEAIGSHRQQDENDIRNGPAASKGGAVRTASAAHRAHGAAPDRSDISPARESDRKVDWVRAAVATYERPLTQYSLHLLGGDLERARDLVQEAFLRLIGQEEEAVEGHLAEWLYTVCRNLAIDVKRKERRMRLVTEEQQDTFAAAHESPTDVAERVDAYSRVAEMMQNLPPRQQEIVRLKFQHGMSYKEIGDVMNLTATNVGFILHTAIKSLRQGMGADPQRTGSDT